MSQIVIYTDGAITKNPGGTGGHAALLFWNNTGQAFPRKKSFGGNNPARPLTKRLIWGTERVSTSSRSELLAVIDGVRQIRKPDKHEIIVFTDSKYVERGINEWMHAWIQEGWRTRTAGDVKNVDLWQTMFALWREMQFVARHVPGHRGNTYNGVVDFVAKHAAKGTITSRVIGDLLRELSYEDRINKRFVT